MTGIQVDLYRMVGELYVKMQGQAEMITQLQAEIKRLQNGLPDLISVEEVVLAEAENG